MHYDVIFVVYFSIPVSAICAYLWPDKTRIGEEIDDELQMGFEHGSSSLRQEEKNTCCRENLKCFHEFYAAVDKSHLFLTIFLSIFIGDNLIIGSFDNRLSWFDLDLSSKPYQTLRWVFMEFFQFP